MVFLLVELYFDLRLIPPIQDRMVVFLLGVHRLDQVFDTQIQIKRNTQVSVICSRFRVSQFLGCIMLVYVTRRNLADTDYRQTMVGVYRIFWALCGMIRYKPKASSAFNVVRIICCFSCLGLSLKDHFIGLSQCNFEPY